MMTCEVNFGTLSETDLQIHYVISGDTCKVLKKSPLFHSLLLTYHLVTFALSLDGKSDGFFLKVRC